MKYTIAKHQVFMTRQMSFQHLVPHAQIRRNVKYPLRSALTSAHAYVILTIVMMPIEVTYMHKTLNTPFTNGQTWAILTGDDLM